MPRADPKQDWSYFEYSPNEGYFECSLYGLTVCWPPVAPKITDLIDWLIEEGCSVPGSGDDKKEGSNSLHLAKNRHGVPMCTAAAYS